jgi:5-bromo-4-chloroindolyl phosphate hydrolysis protein
LLRRVTISDIKSPIYQEIKNNKEVFFKLNEFVFSKLENTIIEPTLKNDFHYFLFSDNQRNALEYRIIDAAHIYSSF